MSRGVSWLRVKPLGLGEGVGFTPTWTLGVIYRLKFKLHNKLLSYTSLFSISMAVPPVGAGVSPCVCPLWDMLSYPLVMVTGGESVTIRFIAATILKPGSCKSKVR